MAEEDTFALCKCQELDKHQSARRAIQNTWQLWHRNKWVEIICKYV